MMEKENNDNAEESIELPKLPFNRIKFSLKRVVDIAIPVHVETLNAQSEAIENLKIVGSSQATLRHEQVEAFKTIQLLKADLFELEQAHLQVKETDQEQFQKYIQNSLKNAVEALSNFMALHSDVVGPFLDDEIASIENPAIIPPLVCDISKEIPIEEVESSGSLVQLKTERVVYGKVTSDAWSFIRKELLEVHSLICQFSALVFKQQESVDNIQTNVVQTHENVREGTKYLKKASLLKAASFPVAGAVIGGFLLGPVGALAGFKLLGSAACLAGGSVIGYGAGVKLKKNYQASADIELKALTYSSKAKSSSNPELFRDLKTQPEN